ncbi:MAG: pilus assembly PilX family protein, partial [Planctomycetota bacterium]
MKLRKKRKAAALIVSMIFMLIFSALAVSLATISDTNTQIADNLRKANSARACAESGLEIIRCWFDQVTIPGETPESQRFYAFASSFQSAVSDISNITVNWYDAGTMTTTITVPTITLNSEAGQSFSAQIREISPSILQVGVTGTCGPVTRTITASFGMSDVRHPIFDFGMASKGPLFFEGNPTIAGVNNNQEADIYIESTGSNLALSVSGNTNFDGDVSIANPMANYNFGGDISIGGEQGQTAIDNHVFVGVEPTEFPVPNTGHFQQYATGDIVDEFTDLSDSMVLANSTIKAGTNPHFIGNVTIKGILFIEQPNIVTFGGNADIQGMIVANGDVSYPGSNEITFLGNFQSSPFPSGSEFDVMRHEAGSSLLAPGFAASFLGNFATLSGVMAISG